MYLDAPIGKDLWVYTSKGLPTVGQDEVILLLIRLNDDESLPRREIFEHFQSLYEQARGGIPLIEQVLILIL